MNEAELADALTDVRRAWRLVYAWQRRVNDLHIAVDDVLRSQGLAFQRWTPLHNKPPTRAGTPFFQGRWAWDMLPGWATSSHWVDVRRRKGSGRRRRVVFQCLADTGRHYDGDEPDPVGFEDVEKSRSELRIGLWTSTADRPDWGAAWQAVLAEDVEGWDWDGELHLDQDDGGYTYEYRQLDIARLLDQARTRALLLDPLSQWCEAKAREAKAREARA